MMIRPGQDIPPELLVSILADGGYERQDPVDEHGEFCLRGGILDIFPAGEEVPLRLEFVGDTVESLRRFDPDSQRSVESVDQFLLVPVRDFALRATAAPAADAAASIIDYLGRAAVIVAEPDDVRAQVERDVCPRAGRRSRSAAAARMPRRCCHPRHSSSTGPTWRRCFARATTLEELSLGRQPPHLGLSTARPRSHVAYQPPQEFKGRIPEWVADVRQALARADTVLFVAGSRGRAERTVELLRDYDVRASWAGHGSDQPDRRRAGGRWPALARLPAARRGAHRATRPPTSSRKSAGADRSGWASARRRPPFCPTCAI